MSVGGSIQNLAFHIAGFEPSEGCKDKNGYKRTSDIEMSVHAIERRFKKPIGALSRSDCSDNGNGLERTDEESAGLRSVPPCGFFACPFIPTQCAVVAESKVISGFESTAS